MSYYENSLVIKNFSGLIPVYTCVRLETGGWYDIIDRATQQVWKGEVVSQRKRVGGGS